VGAYCLGGCDIRYSHTIDSCLTAPTCKSEDFTFDSLDGIQGIEYYLGDANKANWQATGRPVIYDDSALLLTMAPDTVGTLLASTHYVWYGKISATMTTSRGAGVVTAFIMMSDVLDEIDFEFVGVDIEHAQSNYYYQGILDYTHSDNLTVGNTYEEVHTYTIDWKPDSLTWLVDGKAMRTLTKKQTWNDTANRYDYPQTPSRVMLSLWPAGLPKNGQGTINWSGGLVDWNSPYMTNGYYSAMFKEVSVECYDPPSDATIHGDKAYHYTDVAGTEADVEITDDFQVLKSLYGTGEDLEKDPDATHSSSSATSSATYTPETVPGMSGGGSGHTQNGGNGGGGGGGGGSNVNSGGEPLSTGQSVKDGFQQGLPSPGDSAGTALVPEGRFVGGSVFAVIVAILALMVM